MSLRQKFNDGARGLIDYISPSAAEYLTAERHLPSPRVGTVLLAGFLAAGCASEAIMPPQVAPTQPTARTNALALSEGRYIQQTDPANYNVLSELEFIATPLGDNEAVYLDGKEVAENCRIPIKLLPEEHHKRVVKGQEIAFVSRGDNLTYALVRAIRVAPGKLEFCFENPEYVTITKRGAVRTLDNLHGGIVGTRSIPEKRVDWKTVNLGGPDVFSYVPAWLNPPKPGEKPDPRLNTVIVKEPAEKWTETRTSRNQYGQIVESDENSIRGEAYLPVKAEFRVKPRPPAPTPQQIQAQKDAVEKARAEEQKKEAIRIDMEGRKAIIIK
ncbi:MAG: hypothetical protein NT076_01585 [Candidatus Pacearchaeota archaeon]|nr:hypothetical protein [Candidatus Pacearchaeota archaeon]